MFASTMLSEQLLGSWHSERHDSLALYRSHQEVLMERTCRLSPMREWIDQLGLCRGMMQLSFGLSFLDVQVDSSLATTHGLDGMLVVSVISIYFINWLQNIQISR